MNVATVKHRGAFCAKHSAHVIMQFGVLVIGIELGLVGC